jgi:hypothetical protein
MQNYLILGFVPPRFVFFATAENPFIDHDFFAALCQYQSKPSPPPVLGEGLGPAGRAIPSDSKALVPL